MDFAGQYRKGRKVRGRGTRRVGQGIGSGCERGKMGGKKRREEDGAVYANTVVPRVLRIYGRVHTRAYKPHNSPSGDPYPTNFQIINISVAALLRAS